MKKTLAIASLAMISAMAATPAFAADEFNTAPGLTAAGAPLGLHGFDPVAFLDIGNRVEGRAEFTAIHDGVAYYFSTEANMRKFKRNAADYTPQNGGFCTYGVSVGKKFDGDPQFADVRDGKLFVFLNEEIFNAYQKDEAGTIATADEKWAKIKHTAAKDL